MSRSFVNLPGWFPAAKAAAVLRGMNREFALISGVRGGVSVASLADLSRAPVEKTTEWCATPSAGFATPLETVEEVWRKMVDLKTERLPVQVGELIVGIVTSSALRSALRRSKPRGQGRDQTTHQNHDFAEQESDPTTAAVAPGGALAA